MINIQLFKRINHTPIYSQRHDESMDKYYSITKYINKNLNKEEMIWGLDEPRGFQIDNSNNRYIQDNYVLTFSYLLRNNNKKDVYKFLADFNIKYFLWSGMNDSENISRRMLWAKLPNGSKRYANFTLDNYGRVIKFLKNNTELVKKENNYYLYKLKDNLAK